MFGNVVNMTRLKELMDRQALIITGFEPGRMRAIHYPLRPIRVYERGDENVKGVVERPLKHDFSKVPSECALGPGQYVIVEAHEQIEMKQQGLIGHFVLPSHFIERGLALVAGRIESPYGQKGEAVRFGLKNMLDRANRLLNTDTLAYVYFVDLLSLRNEDPYKLTSDDERLFRAWRTRRERAGDSGAAGDYYADGD